MRFKRLFRVLFTLIYAGAWIQLLYSGAAWHWEGALDYKVIDGRSSLDFAIVTVVLGTIALIGYWQPGDED